MTEGQAGEDPVKQDGGDKPSRLKEAAKKTLAAMIGKSLGLSADAMLSIFNDGVSTLANKPAPSFGKPMASSPSPGKPQPRGDSFGETLAKGVKYVEDFFSPGNQGAAPNAPAVTVKGIKTNPAPAKQQPVSPTQPIPTPAKPPATPTPPSQPPAPKLPVPLTAPSPTPIKAPTPTMPPAPSSSKALVPVSRPQPLPASEYVPSRQMNSLLTGLLSTELASPVRTSTSGPAAAGGGSGGRSLPPPSDVGGPPGRSPDYAAAIAKMIRDSNQKAGDLPIKRQSESIDDDIKNMFKQALNVGKVVAGGSGSNDDDSDKKSGGVGLSDVLQGALLVARICAGS
jgi:hypothetical protein